jgi:pilus assembly protein Flp/PilA
MLQHITLLTNRMFVRFQELRTGEAGQGLVEYAFILALVSIAAIGGLTLVGVNVNSELSSIANKI